MGHSSLATAAARAGGKRPADDRRIVAFAVGTSGKDVQQGVDTRRILQLAQQGQ